MDAAEELIRLHNGLRAILDDLKGTLTPELLDSMTQDELAAFYEDLVAFQEASRSARARIAEFVGVEPTE